MGKKQESVKTAGFLRSLQLEGHFRKLTDMYQVGMPDIIGSYKGKFFGVEIKAVSEVPQNGLAPSKQDHRFTGEQIKEMANIEICGGGVALAIVICGDRAFWFTQDQIDRATGQVNIARAIENKRWLDNKESWWDVRPMLEFCYESGHFKGREGLIC